jgi:hypothetical protein
MLNEGIHVEDINGVLLLRPTVSPIIYYQQIGRAIQAGGKNQPIIFDLVNNFDSLGASKFSGDLLSYSQAENKEDKEKTFDEIEFFIVDEIKQVKELFLDITKRLSSDWDELFVSLQQYKKEFGNCDVFRTYIVDGKPLGAWVKNQRTLNSRGNLEKEKVEQLNNEGFIWDSHIHKWEENYLLVKEYFEKFNTIILPSKGKYKNISLSTWATRQRNYYKEGKNSSHHNLFLFI